MIFLFLKAFCKLFFKNDIRFLITMTRFWSQYLLRHTLFHQPSELKKFLCKILQIPIPRFHNIASVSPLFKVLLQGINLKRQKLLIIWHWFFLVISLAVPGDIAPSKEHQRGQNYANNKKLLFSSNCFWTHRLTLSRPRVAATSTPRVIDRFRQIIVRRLWSAINSGI